MRSRYSAFVFADEPYLMRTWHPSCRPVDLQLRAGGVGQQWLGLRIVQCTAGTEEDNRGEVEFVARYKRGGRAYKIHERSRFVRENGQWFYVGGIMEPAAEN